jgi:hypothetical protein
VAPKIKKRARNPLTIRLCRPTAAPDDETENENEDENEDEDEDEHHG